MEEIIKQYFKGFKEFTVHNLSYLVEGIMRSGRASVWYAAQAMSPINGQSFKTNEKRGNRLLQDENFQIDDTTFRRYIKLLFDAMHERSLLKIGDNIQINVDDTSDTDEFLILMASVHFGSKAVPLFFSIRNYPEKKNQFDQKKMESSFIKALRHLLPKKYTYTIVADRGFGNARFAQLCEENGFDFVLRINENLKIQKGNCEENLKKYIGKNTSFEAYNISANKSYRFEIQTKNGSTWFLMMPTKSLDGASKYQKRFSIEKCFQDQKSSGFNIESSKIRKYSRFKRLYFSMCLAQLFAVMIGEYVDNQNHPLKKNFPTLAKLISVFSGSDTEFAKIASPKSSKS